MSEQLSGTISLQELLDMTDNKTEKEKSYRSNMEKSGTTDKKSNKIRKHKKHDKKDKKNKRPKENRRDNKTHDKKDKNIDEKTEPLKSTSKGGDEKIPRYNMEHFKEMFEELYTAKKSIEFKGYGNADYKLDSYEFRRGLKRFVIIDQALNDIVQNEAIASKKDIKRLTKEKKKILKHNNIKNSEDLNLPSNSEHKKSMKALDKKIHNIEKSLIKTQGIALLTEMLSILITKELCICEDELPCCDPDCEYSKTLLSIVERIDEIGCYSDDSEESDPSSEDTDGGEAFFSDEYSSYDEQWEGVSEQSTDNDSMDDSFIEL